MADLRLVTEVDDENPDIGDLYLSRGRVVLTDDATVESTAQKLRIRLQFFRGEYFADTRQGIPYLVEDDEASSILGNKIDLVALRVLFREVFLTTPGVASVDELLVSFDDATRIVSIEFVATHESGVTFTSADFGPFLVGLR